jgi:hypothetical protein
MVDSRAFCQAFFPWYNTEHRHSGIGLLTPYEVHHGLADQRIADRAQVLASAYTAHPERFVGGLPQPPARPTEVWINPPKPLSKDRSEKPDLVGSPQSHDLDPGEDIDTPNNSVCSKSITLSLLRALH